MLSIWATLFLSHAEAAIERLILIAGADEDNRYNYYFFVFREVSVGVNGKF